METSIQQHRAGLIAVTVAAILWSTGGLFIKLLPFDPFTILFYRSVCAAIIFGWSGRRNLFKLNKISLFVSCCYAGLLVCFVTSTKMTTAANAIFLQYTAPAYILLLEPVLFKLKLERINVITVLVCFVGMALFLFGDLSMGNMAGNLIALGSGILLAAVMLGQRFNDPEKNEPAVFWGNILVILIGLPWYLNSAPPTPPEWGMLLFLGFIQIGLGYWLFTYGLQRTLAVESAMLAVLEPILNPVWVYLGYGEAPSRLAIIGGIIIILALAGRLIIRERMRKSATGSA